MIILSYFIPLLGAIWISLANNTSLGIIINPLSIILNRAQGLLRPLSHMTILTVMCSFGLILFLYITCTNMLLFMAILLVMVTCVFSVIFLTAFITWHIFKVLGSSFTAHIRKNSSIPTYNGSNLPNKNGNGLIILWQELLCKGVPSYKFLTFIYLVIFFFYAFNLSGVQIEETLLDIPSTLQIFILWFIRYCKIMSFVIFSMSLRFRNIVWILPKSSKIILAVLVIPGVYLFVTYLVIGIACFSIPISSWVADQYYTVTTAILLTLMLVLSIVGYKYSWKLVFFLRMAGIFSGITFGEGTGVESAESAAEAAPHPTSLAEKTEDLLSSGGP